MILPIAAIDKHSTGSLLINFLLSSVTKRLRGFSTNWRFAVPAFMILVAVVDEFIFYYSL